MIYFIHIQTKDDWSLALSFKSQPAFLSIKYDLATLVQTNDDFAFLFLFNSVIATLVLINGVLATFS
jgi:hypothetical protein